MKGRVISLTYVAGKKETIVFEGQMEGLLPDGRLLRVSKSDPRLADMYTQSTYILALEVGGRYVRFDVAPTFKWLFNKLFSPTRKVIDATKPEFVTLESGRGGMTILPSDLEAWVQRATSSKLKAGKEETKPRLVS